jgi:hypothetical protein
LENLANNLRIPVVIFSGAKLLYQKCCTRKLRKNLKKRKGREIKCNTTKEIHEEKRWALNVMDV